MEVFADRDIGQLGDKAPFKIYSETNKTEIL